jgi:hypothetical protein
VSADIVLVTLLTGVPTLVLDRKGLPLIDIRQSMVVVGKALAVNAEIIRNQKHASQEDQPDEPNGNP